MATITHASCVRLIRLLRAISEKHNGLLILTNTPFYKRGTWGYVLVLKRDSIEYIEKNAQSKYVSTLHVSFVSKEFYQTLSFLLSKFKKIVLDLKQGVAVAIEKPLL